MKGRVHIYEGQPAWKCCVPIRVMKLLGVKMLILTNAAGGINTNYKIGDFMVIRDHISIASFCGLSPLVGPNDERWGPRFPLMTNAYDPNLRKKLIKVAKEVGLEQNIHEGIYFFTTGPQFEGEKDISLLRLFGADAVGMSTVHETIVARHCGIQVLAISLITDLVDFESHHEQIVEVSKTKSNELGRLILYFASELVNSL